MRIHPTKANDFIIYKGGKTAAQAVLTKFGRLIDRSFQGLGKLASGGVSLSLFGNVIFPNPCAILTFSHRIRSQQDLTMGPCRLDTSLTIAILGSHVHSVAEVCLMDLSPRTVLLATQPSLLK